MRKLVLIIFRQMPGQAPATVNIQEMPTAENGREVSAVDIVTPSGTLTVTPPAPSAVIYLLSGLVYAGFGLIGWRITRCYDWKGLLAFLVAGACAACGTGAGSSNQATPVKDMQPLHGFKLAGDGCE